MSAAIVACGYALWATGEGSPIGQVGQAIVVALAGGAVVAALSGLAVATADDSQGAWRLYLFAVALGSASYLLLLVIAEN
ncbi:hypothetical protein [Paraconexibacter sp. AEG42_29]|uniref:hypothetical protein n=1 Tax=Paraconexibacter sp. AEG42_29 TaxID=2997339 RepID=UPI00339D4ACF